MPRPACRDDLSRFLIHRTREYEGARERKSLLTMLYDKTIEARNAHRLFVHEIEPSLRQVAADERPRDSNRADYSARPQLRPPAHLSITTDMASYRARGL